MLEAWRVSKGFRRRQEDGLLISVDGRTARTPTVKNGGKPKGLTSGRFRATKFRLDENLK